MATLLPDEDVSLEDLKGYRVFIFSHDHPHPPHVHVRKGKRFSSWDLTTLQCVDRGGFSTSDVATQRAVLVRYGDVIRRNWNAHWQRQGGQG